MLPLLVVPQPIVRLCYAIGLFTVAIFSLIPSQALPPLAIGDKAEHLLAYVALSWTGVLAARGRRVELRTGLLLVVLGCVLEVLQMLVPGRSADLRDVAADALGVLLGIVLARLSVQVVRIEA